MKFSTFALFCWLLAGCMMPAAAQTNKKIKALESQKKEIQKGLKRKQTELASTRKDVEEKMRDILLLTNRIENRQRYIEEMERQIAAVEARIARRQEQIAKSERELKAKKEDYVRALRFARASKTVSSPLLFVLSTRSVTQMYRRSRYAREYANYERSLAEQILDKQEQLLKEKNELLKEKAEKHRLAAECEVQRAALQQQQEEEERNVAGLRKRQKALAEEVERQKKQLAALDKKIDELIEWEMEQARLKAEREVRQKAEAQRGKQTGKAKTGKQTTPQKSAGQWLTAQDRELEGSFERNKGRLPVPITGSYMVGSRFGTYNVPGLKNVRLDNKGTNYIGKPGAKARVVFDGEVSAIFQFGGTTNVLVRHGSYISVYCNLSSVIVRKGQHLKARDIIGTVDNDGADNCVLHFQLRKETAKLNPEQWIGR